MRRFAALVGILCTLCVPAAAQDVFANPMLAPCLTADTVDALAPAVEAAGWSALDPESGAGTEALAASQQGFSALVFMARAFETRDEVAAFVENAARSAPPPVAVAGLYESRRAQLLVMALDTGTGTELECVLFGRELEVVEDVLGDAAPMQGLAAAFVLDERPGAGADPDSISAIRIHAPGRATRLLDGRDSLRLTRFIPQAD